MQFFRNLEKKFGKYAVKGLMTYLTVLYGVGIFVSPYYYPFLYMDVSQVLQGQVWRLLSWLIYPPSSNILFALIGLLLYYSLGHTLENLWGSFRFNVYIFMGIFFHIAACFVMYFAFGEILPITPAQLNMSIFLAFAASFPEMEFRLYFAIPVKAKVLAFVYLLIEVYHFWNGSLSTRIAIVMSLFNLIVFWIVSGRLRTQLKTGVRKAQWSGGIASGKIKAAVHVRRCTVCGRTPKDAPELEFRYCSKCQGNYEYCSEHIFTHAHISANISQEHEGEDSAES